VHGQADHRHGDHRRAGGGADFAYFGELIDKIDGMVTSTAADAFHYILREPLGVVGCIVPWNYPLLMAPGKSRRARRGIRCVEAAEQSPLSGLLMAQLFIEAGGRRACSMS